MSIKTYPIFTFRWLAVHALAVPAGISSLAHLQQCSLFNVKGELYDKSKSKQANR